MAIEITCPTCQRALKLPDSLIGQRVQCPGCAATFDARPEAEPPPRPALQLPEKHDRPWERGLEPEDERRQEREPERERRRFEDEEEPRPSRRRKRERFLCPTCDSEVEPGMRRCPECGERLDFGDEEDRPWERPGYQRLDTQPHRGTLVLVLGIIGMVVNSCAPVGLFFSLPAWVMGHFDLRAMKEGRMDITGQGTTQAGFILGIIGSSIGLLYVIGIASLILLSIMA